MTNSDKVSADNSDSFVETVLAREKPLPPFQWKNVFSEIQWISFLALTLTPIVALYGLLTCPLQPRTLAWAVAYYFLTGLGITGGYHRLWSHRAYTASAPLQAFLICMGSGAVQGSAHWWARGHRSHHRYTDTDLDPYGAHTGLAWAHMGWMIVKPRRKPGPVDTSDLKKNKFIQFQHKFYLPMILFWGFVFPTLVAGLGWGDWAGGYYFAGVARLVFVHHSTFCINSLAHYLGEASFDARHSPRDNFITALATIGEGYHNFHHEFPMDFRNAVRWYQYDPTKWFIWGMSKIGLASNLKIFPDNEVRKGRLAMQLREAHKQARQLEWARAAEELPVLTWDDFETEAKTRPLVAIHGFIHDVSKFMDEHPGGRTLIQTRIGRDATTAFEGGVYDHSNAAHNLLSMMRVGVLSGGYEPAKVWPAKTMRGRAAASSETPEATSASSSSESDLAELHEHVAPARDLDGQGALRKRSGADNGVNTDSAMYIPPGEAYRVLERRKLEDNVKVRNTHYGKLF